MPKPSNGTKTSKATPPKSLAASAAKAAEGLPVLHPEIKTTKCFGASALTYEAVKQIFALESEDEFATRIAAEENAKDPTVKLDGKGIKFKEKDVLFVHEGVKYAAWNNAGNRPFDLNWALSIRQDILAGQWAGPTTLPDLQEYTYGGTKPYTMADGTVINPGDKFKLSEGTVNGEAFIISRSGRVKSAQHRGVAFYLAVLEWRKYPEKYPRWPSEPVLETLITWGVSDAERVTTTMDNNKSRTEADSFYTTGAVQRIFGGDAAKLSQRERAEACRMLQSAVNFLWQRCGKGAYLYQTHSATQRFLDDHPRLYKAVRHIWSENSQENGRRLSILRLQPGQCAACLYMMATCKSDLTKWDAQTGKESQLDVSLWKDAEDFWTNLAGKTGQHRAIADEVGVLMDDPEAPTRGVGKLAIIAKAWEAISKGSKLRTVKEAGPDGELLRSPDLALEYGEADGKRVLVNAPGFGGIDLGPSLRQPDEDDEITEAQAKAAQARIDKSKAPKPDAPKTEENSDEVRRKVVSKVLAKKGPDTTKAPGEVAKPAPVLKGPGGKPAPVKALSAKK